jgi:hypothetical protein
MRFGRAAWAMAGIVACQPVTSRPAYQPVPQAASTEVRLPAREATRLLAEALRQDSIPASRVFLRDAWLETSWFDPANGERIRHRPIGRNVVLVRAWADPTQPGSSKITVETVYRPAADPSLPERELDLQVPRDHPVAIKVRSALQGLVKQYGGPPAQVAPPAASPGTAPDAGQPPGDEQPDGAGVE